MRIKKLYKPKILITFVLAILITLMPKTQTVLATSYNYDFWSNVLPSADGLAYLETYYREDIKAADNSNQMISLSGATDMEVYDGKIYLLTAPLNSASYQLREGVTVATSKMGTLTILNSNMEWTDRISEFLISDEVKQQIDEYYDFNVPLDKITLQMVQDTEMMSKAPYVPYTEDETKAAIRLQEPSGITVTSDGIYISDSQNSRIIFLNAKEDYLVTKIYFTPNDTAFYQISESIPFVNSKYSVVFKTEKAFENKEDLNDEAIKIAVMYGSMPAKLTAAQIPNAQIVYLSNQDDVLEALATGAVDAFITTTDNADSIVNDPKFSDSNRDKEILKDISLSAVKEIFTAYNYNGRKFIPQKLAVDKAGRLYCTAKDTYEGIICYDNNTTFSRYIGKNEVVASAWKKFWGKLFSETQISQQTLDLPPLFTNIAMSDKNTLYSTSNPDADDPKANKMVKAINTAGTDVLKRNGYVAPDGDAAWVISSNVDGAVTGSSNLVAIAVNSVGTFTVVDSKRGRLFTYDSEGNLLYICGDQPGGTSTKGSGTGLSNCMVSPIAVDYLYRTQYDSENNPYEEELIVVLDDYSESLLFYTATEFGKQINMATYLYQKGDYVGAEQYWRNVAKLNTNYEQAYLGIGKSLYTQGRYKEAMEYFELSHSARYYSQAYSIYRDSWLQDNFNWIMAGVIVIVVVIVAAAFVPRIVRKQRGIIEEGGDE